MANSCTSRNKASSDGVRGIHQCESCRSNKNFGSGSLNLNRRSFVDVVGRKNIGHASSSLSQNPYPSYRMILGKGTATHDAEGNRIWHVGNLVNARIHNCLWEGKIQEIMIERGQTRFKVHFPAREETIVVGASDLQPPLSCEDVQTIEPQSVEAKGKRVAATVSEELKNDQAQNSGSVEDRKVLKRKAESFGETSAHDKVRDSGYNGGFGKVVSDFSEPRRSSRKIQPTSKLLEGLEASFGPCWPATSDGKGTRAGGGSIFQR